MSNTQQILSQTAHRPYPLPEGSWQYYQEWNNVIFLHYEVPYEALRPLVPASLQLDSLNGKFYISVVPFSMQKIRPKNLPPFPPISDFHEINVRTYIQMKGRQGVYFINIEAQKRLSAWLAKRLSGLPYEKSHIVRTVNTYTNKHKAKNFRLNLDFHIGEQLTYKSILDQWLTERYCLFLERNRQLQRYDIHHIEWPIYRISFSQRILNYPIGQLSLIENNLISMHYSPGVQVLSWQAMII